MVETAAAAGEGGQIVSIAHQAHEGSRETTTNASQVEITSIPSLSGLPASVLAGMHGPYG